MQSYYFGLGGLSVMEDHRPLARGVRLSDLHLGGGGGGGAPV